MLCHDAPSLFMPQAPPRCHLHSLCRLRNAANQRRRVGHTNVLSSPRRLRCNRLHRGERTKCLASEDRASYRLITLTLKKPMGLVLEDNPRNKTVFVAEVVAGGHADRSGQVEVGDILTKCSATVLKDGKEGEYEREGYGQRLYTNWDKVMFSTEGEDFDTVMKAIASNTERWGIFDVTLELKRYVGAKPDEA